MLVLAMLCLALGVQVTTWGWSLHRNCDPIGYPTEWRNCHPFKQTDNFVMVVIKGMSASLAAAAVAVVAWGLGWLLGADGWSFGLLAVILLNVYAGFVYFDDVSIAFRWWWFDLNGADRRRIRQRDRDARRNNR